MKVIICIKDDVRADLVALAIESYFEEIKTESFSSREELFHALAKDSQECLIVSDLLSSVDGERLSQTARFFVCILGFSGAALALPNRVGSVGENFTFVELMVSLKALCPALKVSLQNRFCKIAIKTLLLNRGIFSVDVYIRLSDTKFLKAINCGDSFTSADFKKYSDRNITFLYIKSADFLHLADEWMAEIKSLSADSANCSIENIAKVFSSIHESIHYMFPDEGFTPEMQSLAEESVKAAVAVVKQNAKISKLIEGLLANKVPYISAHSTAESFLACKLATYLGWDQESTFYKLGMAAYLHDITLEKDEWALLDDKKLIEESNIGPEAVNAILTHPRSAASLLKGTGEFPMDVGFIIEQHHERADGDGFPKGVTTEISAISALFILAHDITSAMFKSGNIFDLGKYLRNPDVVLKFSRGNSAKVFKIVKEKVLDEEG